MKKTQAMSSLALLLTATIWGIAFVAQSVGMDYVSPFTFNGVRCAIAGVSLLPVIFFMRKSSGGKTAFFTPDLVKGGLLCGVCLFAASSFQQIGLQYTTVGKSGFITACYIVFIPLMGIAVKKRPTLKTWLAVALAVLGLYMLCMSGEISINKGDVYTLICSLGFALHVMVIDYYSPRVDGVKLSCIQFFVCAALSSVCMALFEAPELSLIIQARLPILYAGVMSGGVAYTLQIIAQKNIAPTTASLILSLESCVAVLAGWLLLGQSMASREITGCFIMFAAIIIAQLPEKPAAEKPAFALNKKDADSV